MLVCLEAVIGCEVHVFAQSAFERLAILEMGYAYGAATWQCHGDIECFGVHVNEACRAQIALIWFVHD